MSDPVLIGPGYSTYTRSPRLALEEKGVAYSLEEVDFIGSGWPPGVPRPDAVMMPSPDREGFIRRLSMAVTRSRSA